MSRRIARLPLLLLASPAAAQSGGVLPLRHGTYVAEGTPCADAPFAAMQNYNGTGIGDPHSSDCHARILSRRGPTVVLDNNCRDAGTGPAPRSNQRLELRIEGPARYAIITRGQADSFRWCSAEPGR